MAFLLAAALCVFLLSSCISVNADNPANCTYEEIRGTWLFSIGEGGHDNTINCSEFRSASELQVQLLFPDVAVDSEGNVGVWTLIYNQGFEVQINGKVYFAFSAYEKSGQKVVSYCDRTLNGCPEPWRCRIQTRKLGLLQWYVYHSWKIELIMSAILQSEASIYAFDRYVLHSFGDSSAYFPGEVVYCTPGRVPRGGYSHFVGYTRCGMCGTKRYGFLAILFR